MSKAEILAELPKLEAEDRRQVFARLCELQEQDLLQGIGPTDQEMAVLDKALADFQQDGDRGVPWRQAIRDLRSSGRS